MLYKQGARCKIASRGSDASTYVVTYLEHASRILRTASFAWNVPGETASEHYIVIVLPNCIGGFVVSATNLDFLRKGGMERCLLFRI